MKELWYELACALDYEGDGCGLLGADPTFFMFPDYGHDTSDDMVP